MINKDGKLFGKISIIDIIAIILIIIMIIGTAFLLSGHSEKVKTESEKFEFVYLVKNVRINTAKALEKKGNMFDKVSNEFIGEITDVKVEKGEYPLNMADGTIENGVPEDRYNVYLTVGVSGKVSDTGYYTSANKYIGAGTSIQIATKYAECEGKVFSVAVK